MKYAVKIEAGSTESRLLQELAFIFGYSWYGGQSVEKYGPYLFFYDHDKTITWWSKNRDNSIELSIENMIEFIKGKYTPIKTLEICGKKIEIIPGQVIRIGDVDLTDKQIQEIMGIYKSK